MFTELLIFDGALATKTVSLKIHLWFLYYPFDLIVNKCDGICNTIDNLHT